MGLSRTRCRRVNGMVNRRMAVRHRKDDNAAQQGGHDTMLARWSLGTGSARHLKALKLHDNSGAPLTDK
jgi:hypothetical protein